MPSLRRRTTTAALVSLALAVLGTLWPLGPATGAEVGGHIEGRVLGPGGTAVKDPTVFVLEWSTQDQEWQGVGFEEPVAVGAGGTFRTPEVPAGTYRIWLGNLANDDTVYWPAASTARDATDVVVVAGQDKLLGDVRLLGATRISGRVLGPSGAAAAEVAVTPYRLQGGQWTGSSECSAGSGENTVHTDVDGRYSLNGLAPGTYRVEFCSGDSAFEYWNNARSLATASNIVLGASQSVTGIDARLEQGGVITGTALGPGQVLSPCMQVFAYQRSGGAWVRVPSYSGVENDGRFRLEGLAAGTYRVEAVDDASCAETPGAEAPPTYSGGGADLESASDVVVTAGGTTTTNLALVPGGAGLAGRLIGRDGTAALGLVPTLYRQEKGAWAAYRTFAPTDASGYAVPSVATGTYRLGFVDAYGGTDFWGGDTVEEARSFTVESGQALQKVDIRLGEQLISAQARPAISGTAIVGDALTADPGTYSPADVDLDYRWLADGTAISGATSPTFVPGAAQVGRKLSVKVTASATGHAAVEAVSAGTPAVRKLTVVARISARNTRAGSDVLVVRTGQPLAAKSSVSFYRKKSRGAVRVKTARLNSAGAVQVTVRDYRKRKRASYYAKVSTSSVTNAVTSNRVSVR